MPDPSYSRPADTRSPTILRRVSWFRFTWATVSPKNFHLRRGGGTAEPIPHCPGPWITTSACEATKKRGAHGTGSGWQPGSAAYYRRKKVEA